MKTVSRQRTITGTIELRRIGRIKFPVAELVADGVPEAQLGTDSPIKIFFGRGRRVRLADGTEWRIGATTSGPLIVPMITSKAGVIARSGSRTGRRHYGITGSTYGYSLVPLKRGGIRRAGAWVLRDHERELAAIDGDRQTAQTAEPVPIGAVLLAFTLIAHGIPGEAELVPNMY